MIIIPIKRKGKKNKNSMNHFNNNNNINNNNDNNDTYNDNNNSNDNKIIIIIMSNRMVAYLTDPGCLVHCWEYKSMHGVGILRISS